jgi:hypothetical protein
MALVHVKNEHYTNALQIFRCIFRSQETRFGPDSEHSTQTNGMLGYILVKMVDFEEGLKCLSTVSDWQEKRLPKSHPSVRTTQSIIETVKEYIEGKTSVWV